MDNAREVVVHKYSANDWQPTIHVQSDTEGFAPHYVLGIKRLGRRDRKTTRLVMNTYSVPGVTCESLLAVVFDHLSNLQTGWKATPERAKVLSHVNAALNGLKAMGLHVELDPETSDEPKPEPQVAPKPEPQVAPKPEPKEAPKSDTFAPPWNR